MRERLSIGELARRSGLSVSGVRFYSDRGLLVPAGVDPTNGYRSYEQHQVDDAVLIRDLRRLGLTLADVGAFLAASPAARRALIDGHLDALERQLHDARTLAHALHTRLSPSERPMTTTTAMTVSARDLGRALDQVLPAVSRDREHPALSCVLIEAKDGSLRLVATDRYRLAIRDLAARGAPDTTFRSLLGTDTSYRLRAGLPDEGEIAVAVEDHEVTVRGGGLDRSFPRASGSFPDYEAALVRDHDAHEVVVDRDRLHNGFNHFAGQGDVVIVRAGKDIVTLTRRDERLSVPARYDGPEVQVALDPAFAAAAAAAAIGPDLVVEVSKALQPVVFRSADDGTFTTMLMPARLD